MAKFKQGDRVKLSAEWFSVGRHANQRDKRGAVCGESHSEGCVRVKWDEVKQAETYHEDFLESDDGVLA